MSDMYGVVLIEILTAPGCVFCEKAKLRVLNVSQSVRNELPDLAVKIVDVAAHPEIGFKYSVRSTPAIAINGRLEFIGVPKEEDLKARIMKVSSRIQ
jgi:glutaredoxin